MGACFTTDANSRHIDSKMRQHQEQDEKMIKLLFLGPGGSGKSTIFKQLQWLHAGGYTEDDSKSLIQHIHSQIICQMQDCIRYYLTPTQSIPDTPPSECNTKIDKLQEAINTVSKYKTRHILTTEIADCINFIWQNDTKLQGIFNKHHTTKILDETTEYFWNDIERVSANDYIPNKQDIVNVRFRTTGILEKQFVINDREYHIVDVGGQKSERRKWVQCFDEVKAVVFVASLACYNHVMYEDVNKNAMVDTLELFKQTINDKHFEETPIILFLNKRDLFENKVKEVPITTCPMFEDFDINTKNPNDYDDSIKYIKSEFEEQCDNKNRSIYIHITCAMDPQNIENVFDDVTKIIINDIESNVRIM